MKQIIYTDPANGFLAVITPAYRDSSRPAADTDSELLERVIAGGVPPGIAYRVVDSGDLPVDLYFRDQWEDSGGKVVINMDRARAHHMGNIRLARDKALESLDVSFMRAIETGNTVDQRRVAGLKQALRDIPQVFDLSSRNDSPERLKQRWPENLERREG